MHSEKCSREALSMNPVLAQSHDPVRTNDTLNLDMAHRPPSHSPERYSSFERFGDNGFELKMLEATPRYSPPVIPSRHHDI